MAKDGMVVVERERGGKGREKVGERESTLLQFVLYKSWLFSLGGD